MKSNDLMKMGAVLGIGWLLFGPGAAPQEQENYFKLKDGRIIAESKMPGEGYVKFGGKWVLASDLALAAGQAGVTDTTAINPTTQKGWQILNILLQAGSTLSASIINNTTQAKKDLITQIQLKYMVSQSPSYNANFTHTIAQLNTYPLKQLKEILENGK
ncbi:MAG: hypothetical protein ACRBFS_19405 [Aureispira sp.]